MATTASPASTFSSAPYPSDLSEWEWALLVPLLPPPKLGGRPRTVDLRR
jgi:transposase